MPSFPPVQSVHRVLRLLRELNQHASSSVDMLHRATRLPKPTIVRFLETLVAEGYVRQNGRPGWYSVTAQVQSLSSGFHGEPAVVEAGRTVAIAVTRRLKWSVGIATLDQTEIVIRFSTIPFSPIAPYHTTINMRLPLTTRAFGLAYLAFCSEAERTLLLNLIPAKGSSPGYNPEADDLRAVLGRIRVDGFAERHGSSDSDAEPERKASSTLAVPIMLRDRVLATFGVTYYTSAVPRAHAVAEYVPLLRHTADKIAARVRDLQLDTMAQ